MAAPPPGAAGARGVLARMVVYAQQLQALPRRVRRWLRRHLALSLTELALLLALGPGLGWAATMVVDGTTCTLVDAITAANTDTAPGGCPAGSGADTLVLVPGSTHTLTSSNNTTFDGATGLPVVTSTITIQGNGSTVRRSSASAFRLLAVDTTGNLTVQQLTLQGGQTNYGGGVINNGTLTLVQTLVSGNMAPTGPVIHHNAGTVTVDYFNLFGQNGISGLSGVTAGATDVVPSGALSTILDPTLRVNGGPTPTQALVSGSPAVNAVPAANCPTTDQRGFLRPGTGSTACDIGAFELNAALPPVVDSQVSFVAQPATFRTSLTVPTACPANTVGTFSFQALLTVTEPVSLAALKAQVTTLTQGNTLLLADGGAAGVEAVQTFAEVGQFSSGILAQNQTLSVPFVVCLQTLSPFRLMVDVLGQELQP